MVWQTGQKLQGGKYEIIKVLGRGGFGITYHARHQELNTEVVIKTPDILQKKDIEYEKYVQQFQSEGRKLAKFSAKPHAHIVRIRDYFLEAKLPCLVMDFIRGQTLMEIVKTQGRLSEADCLTYIRQIGKALTTIHKAGMVHRDAHPGNIMIQDDGHAVLIDFGIAKDIIPATHSITSNAANPSFALAATFYYAVTGQRPTPSMDRKLNEKSLLIPPKQINRRLSEHINDAILEGMALEKENRPQSMSVWLQLLEPPKPPPSVAPQYQKEVIKPKPSKKNVIRPCSQSSVLHRLRNIPWKPLIILFVIYGSLGVMFGTTSAPLLIVAWALAGALALALVALWGWGRGWGLGLGFGLGFGFGWGRGRGRGRGFGFDFGFGFGFGCALG